MESEDEFMPSADQSDDEFEILEVITPANSGDGPQPTTSRAGSSKKKESSVWTHFDRISKLQAKCRLCSKTISCSSGNGRGSSTASPWNHLKASHKKEHAESKKLGKLSKEKLRLSQPTLKNLVDLEQKKIWRIDDKRACQIHYLIGEMMATDNQPFSIVEDNGFKRLLNHLVPQYNIPSRYYFTTKIVPDIYKKCKTLLLAELQKADHISFTSDVWTCSGNNESFISLTAHWINDQMDLKHAVLKSKHFPGSHTAENISIMLKSMLDEWKIQDKTHTVLRDNGANMVKGVTEAGLNGSACFIHTLQLVIGDAVRSQRAVHDMLAVCRNLVSHFNHSPLACSKFKKIQDLKLKPKKLIQDVPTRWNSSFYMLERLLELRNAVTLYAAEGEVINLTANQWKLAEGTISLLQPFEEITKLISSSESIISDVIPLVKTLTTYLDEENPAHFGVGTMKEEMKTSMTSKPKRFKDIEMNAMYSVATVLDPRYKTKFLSEEAATHAKETIIQEALKFVQAEPEDNLDSATTRIEPTSAAAAAHSVLWACFDKISQSSSTSDGPGMPSVSAVTSQRRMVERELDAYLALNLIRRNDNPFSWWKTNRATFPHLIRLVEKYLSAPASSVYSERLFSEKGLIYEEHRNRMLPKNGEILGFIHHNLKYLDFTY